MWTQTVNPGAWAGACAYPSCSAVATAHAQQLYTAHPTQHVGCYAADHFNQCLPVWGGAQTVHAVQAPVSAQTVHAVQAHVSALLLDLPAPPPCREVCSPPRSLADGSGPNLVQASNMPMGAMPLHAQQMCPPLDVPAPRAAATRKRYAGECSDERRAKEASERPAQVLLPAERYLPGTPLPQWVDSDANAAAPSGSEVNGVLQMLSEADSMGWDGMQGQQCDTVTARALDRCATPSKQDRIVAQHSFAHRP